MNFKMENLGTCPGEYHNCVSTSIRILANPHPAYGLYMGQYRSHISGRTAAS